MKFATRFPVGLLYALSVELIDNDSPKISAYTLLSDIHSGGTIKSTQKCFVCIEKISFNNFFAPTKNCFLSLSVRIDKTQVRVFIERKKFLSVFRKRTF